MLNIKQKLLNFNGSLEINLGSLFVYKGSIIQKNLTYYHREVLPNEIYEWILLSDPRFLLTDMDGVLCKELPSNIIDNSPEYVHWIKTVKANLIPKYPIRAIITGRFECYRKITEDWLKKHGIEYEELVMFPNNQEHDPQSAAKFKANEIQRILRNAGLLNKDMTICYLESLEEEARLIHKLTDKGILCVDNLEIY